MPGLHLMPVPSQLSGRSRHSTIGSRYIAGSKPTLVSPAICPASTDPVQCRGYCWSGEEGQKYRHNETTCPDPCHVRKDYATKNSPQVRNKLSESRSTSHNNRKALERKKKYVQRQAFVWHFRQENVKHVLECAVELCSKNILHCETYHTWG